MFFVAGNRDHRATADLKLPPAFKGTLLPYARRRQGFEAGLLQGPATTPKMIVTWANFQRLISLTRSRLIPDSKTPILRTQQIIRLRFADLVRRFQVRRQVLKLWQYAIRRPIFKFILGITVPRPLDLELRRKPYRSSARPGKHLIRIHSRKTGCKMLRTCAPGPEELRPVRAQLQQAKNQQPRRMPTVWLPIADAG